MAPKLPSANPLDLVKGAVRRRHGARLLGEHAIDRRVGTILLERITSGLSSADATCLRKPARFGA
jgi:hypothetical protein